MRFADFDDSAAKQGYCPGVVGAAWVCEQHLSVALEFTHMPLSQQFLTLDNPSEWRALPFLKD